MIATKRLDQLSQNFVSKGGELIAVTKCAMQHCAIGNVLLFIIHKLIQ